MSGENRYLTLDDAPPLPSYCAARLAEIHRHEYSGETPCIINGQIVINLWQYWCKYNIICLPIINKYIRNID